MDYTPTPESEGFLTRPRNQMVSRAANFLLGAAVINLLLAGCCSAGAIYQASDPQSLQELQQRFPQQPWGAYAQDLPAMMRTAGAMIGLAGIVLAGLLAWMSVAVRRGSAAAMRGARVIVLIEMVALALILIVNVLSAVAAGESAALLGVLVTLGGSLAVLGFTYSHLARTRHAVLQSSALEQEPWDEDA